MPERISNEEVAHVAVLANLKLSTDELERFTSQLGDILAHANEMASLDLDDVEPTAHPYPLSNVMREDVPTPSISRDDVLASAPATEDNMFRVPPVMGDGS